MHGEIRRLKACLNGPRRRDEHPAVPQTPAELAAAAVAAVAAGAEAVHLHPRAVTGRESLLAADVGAAVAAVRAACPPVPVGVTTALWVTGDVRARHEQIAAWAQLDNGARPDFASVNLSEAGWRPLTGLLAGLGVGAEAGVWSVADADILASQAPGAPWLRILVEISGVAASDAVTAADAILARLPGRGQDRRDEAAAPVLLHGEDASCWPLIRHAGRLGLATRIGLEDTLTGPGGQPASDNAALVRFALAAWAAGRPGQAAQTG